MPISKTGPRPKEGAPAKSANGRGVEKAASVEAPKPTTPSAKSPSSRAERAAERRGAILEAAMDEFIARGFAATRLDDVAQRAGVAKGTIYLHFKDKEALRSEERRVGKECR